MPSKVVVTVAVENNEDVEMVDADASMSTTRSGTVWKDPVKKEEDGLLLLDDEVYSFESALAKIIENDHDRVATKRAHELELGRERAKRAYYKRMAKPGERDKHNKRSLAAVRRKKQRDKEMAQLSPEARTKLECRTKLGRKVKRMKDSELEFVMNYNCKNRGATMVVNDTPEFHEVLKQYRARWLLTHKGKNAAKNHLRHIAIAQGQHKINEPKLTETIPMRPWLQTEDGQHWIDDNVNLIEMLTRMIERLATVEGLEAPRTDWTKYCRDLFQKIAFAIMSARTE